MSRQGWALYRYPTLKNEVMGSNDRGDFFFYIKASILLAPPTNLSAHIQEIDTRLECSVQRSRCDLHSMFNDAL